ncbi:ABC transporter permease [Streptomyces sp. MH60]|uniref:ABC transporter permease n=1 Tax=Streptomyces sp. MH60 TaxID=1940758 RepID=UPI000CEDEF8D|nr:ABC transporter permease [Streptomyces sp. MH60]PPS71768.1 Daunorubicin/doxorubicin resistance ABC transporter permease protein DrrB [Streptomyces sp. MH60]
MSTVTYAVADSATLLRRNIKNQLRYPTTALSIVGIPVLFLLLFVYVFGNVLGEGVAPLGGGDDYVNYVLPGLIIMTAATGSLGTAVSTSVDMTEGIIARFKTMAIFRPAILIARVISSVLQTLTSMALVLAVAWAMGFRPNATPVEWLAALALLAAASLALTWLGVAFGLAAKTLDAASNAPFPLILLPFVGSGIVPTDTMPTGLRYFAEYQPFTPMIETLRGLLLGTEIGNNAWIAVAWCAGLTLLGFVWAMKHFNKDRTN